RDSHRGAGSFCPLRRRIDLRKPTTSSKPRVAKVGVTIDFFGYAKRAGPGIRLKCWFSADLSPLRHDV
ncbi:hypothetical protein, partial [Ralstonia pseudosolanacearum]